MQKSPADISDAERRSVHRWNLALKSVLIIGPLAGAAMNFATATGLSFGPFGDVIGVVEIKGEIKHGALASADKIVPALEAAFKNTRVKQVLKIDSRGGAPVEAERIISAIVTYKQKYPKPVTAVIGNLGASAAYMAAMHADRIVAGKYSLVGSIGAILAPWQLDKAIAQLKVSQRVYSSGRLKAFLNPFTPLTNESDAKATELANKVGGAFVQGLQQQRGRHLKAGVDFGTGEVWSGMEAKALGLVDEIGTMETVVGAQTNLKEFNFGPRGEGFASLGSRFVGAIFSAVSDARVGAAAATEVVGPNVLVARLTCKELMGLGGTAMFVPIAGGSMIGLAYWLQAGRAGVRLFPKDKVVHGGRQVPRTAIHEWGPNRCFFEYDLYTTHFGSIVNGEVEKFLFGTIDDQGAKAVRAFVRGDHADVHDSFQEFFEYMAAQKLRAPKGLDWIRSCYGSLGQVDLMVEMQALRLMHCTM